MKKSLKTIALTAGIALASAGSALATSMAVDYANTTGSFINFNGNNTFNFSPSLNSLRITSGSAAGLGGQITGLFNMGAIIGGDAPVTGTGLLTINDGITLFTANVTWADLFTHGTGSTLNTGGVVDLTGAHYTGSNPDLVALAAGPDINVLTFQFAPGVSIEQLASGVYHTSFSGTITIPTPAPDGGMTVAMLGGSLLAFVGVRRKFNS